MGRRPGHDAVVIGGGPAGCAAATTLARAGRSVLVVHAPQGGRTFGIGEGAPPGLDRATDDVFGAGTFVAADHLRSLGNRAAWGDDELVTTDFMFNPFGTGWHLDRVAFDARLLEVAAAAGAEVVPRPPADVGGAVVVDATGRRAVHARRCGARLVTRDRLTAVVAVSSGGVADGHTTVEAVEGGWWYTCPIPHGRRVVAFLTDGDLLDPELRSAPGFDRHVRRTLHVAAVVAAGAPSPPVVVAAGTAHLDSPVGAGWIAAGDAAASFDPLSSQGILTAMLMGREAARQVDEPTAYAARYRTIVDRFEAERRATYQREQRWPDAPFWSRRR